MRKIRILLWISFLALPRAIGAQEAPAPEAFQTTAGLEPIEFGFRYDDNVYRSVSTDGRFADEIYLLDLGANLGVKYGVFKCNLNYQFGADQYQFYSAINNLKNDFELFLSANPDPLSFYFKKDYFLRTSQYQDFNYFDDDNLAGLAWAPPGPWNYGAQYEYFTRNYFDTGDPSFDSRSYSDQGVRLNTQREIDGKFSMRMEGSYNNRQFNRYAVAPSGTSLLSSVQTDETWTLLLNAHFYFESILQDINLEEQRTNSNSYGFSNTVQSVSWAAVVQPVSSLYLQLFFRLYSKIYDIAPLNLPDLRVGFVDEDSQDLLSIRTTWEWSPLWGASLGVSRVRNESTQPGQYYFKNILSAQIKRSF